MTGTKKSQILTFLDTRYDFLLPFGNETFFIETTKEKFFRNIHTHTRIPILNLTKRTTRIDTSPVQRPRACTRRRPPTRAYFFPLSLSLSLSPVMSFLLIFLANYKWSRGIAAGPIDLYAHARGHEKKVERDFTRVRRSPTRLSIRRSPVLHYSLSRARVGSIDDSTSFSFALHCAANRNYSFSR